MKLNLKSFRYPGLVFLLIPLTALNIAFADKGTKTGPVSDSVIKKQNANLSKNTKGKGFGPQSPRDLETKSGDNKIQFNTAPSYENMNLCNIHFHRNAEHRGGEYTKFAGNGDGQGSDTGYVYNGKLSEAEMAPFKAEVCPGKYGSVKSGDTIEIHYVHSSAQVKPGPTLGACLSESIVNPQLRVEGQVFVIVNDSKALDFNELTKVGVKNGYQQAMNIPSNTGNPIVYAGSTTGPGFNEQGSPLQVTWSMRPKVAKVNIATVAKWCEKNIFNEDHAHGVRNLVTDPKLISPL